MSVGLKDIPRFAFFLAGIAAGALSSRSRRRQGETGAELAVIDGVKKSLAELQSCVAAQQAETTARFQQIDAQLQEHAGKLEEHTAKLADVPSTSEIIGAMEQLLSRTMSSLDQRLTNQAQSIEVLTTTVSQTDNLLERVLESLDSLQTSSEPSELLPDNLLQRPTV